MEDVGTWCSSYRSINHCCITLPQGGREISSITCCKSYKICSAVLMLSKVVGFRFGNEQLELMSHYLSVLFFVYVSLGYKHRNHPKLADRDRIDVSVSV